MIDGLNLNVSSIGALCSIVALLILLVGIIYRLGMRYAENKRKSEEELQAYLDGLKYATNTVTARTDLGFLMIRLITSMRFQQVRFLVIGLFYAVLVSFALLSVPLFQIAKHTGSIATDADLSNLFRILAAFAFALLAVSIYLSFRLADSCRAFEQRFTELWKVPMEKHTERARIGSSKSFDG